MSFIKDVNDCFEQHKALREALAALINRVELCGKESAGVFQIAALHGCAYTGPNWVNELEAAKNVLAKYSNT